MTVASDSLIGDAPVVLFAAPAIDDSCIGHASLHLHAANEAEVLS